MSFEKATRLKLRFAINGNCTVEDLWDFSKETLADYEVKLQEIIEKQGKSNRFARKNNKLAIEELKLSIVSYIIDTKVAEEEESANAMVKKQEKEKLLSLLAKRQDEKLAELTEDQIQKRLSEL